jgi:hypothetical protein
MGSLQGLLAELDETAVARNLAIPHDEARMNYRLSKNTVSSFREFEEAISDYYNYHASISLLHGGYYSRAQASGRAKKILEQEYRRRGRNIVSAYNDAHDGTNGGLRVIFDKIAEGLKAEALEQYTRDAFDRHVTPSSWEQKVDIIRQFIAHFGHDFSTSIRADQPERYAYNFEELITEYVESMRRTLSAFRSF